VLGPAARSRIFGIDCFVGDLDAAVDVVLQRAANRQGGRIVLANAHVLVTSLRDHRLRDALDSAWTVFPDGAPVAWLERRSGAPTAQRIAGPDLMPTVLDRGRSYGLRHVLLGSTQTVLDRLEFRFKRQLPGVAIVDKIAPAPGDENSPAVLDRIATRDPHIVWVALGAPKQELWTQRHGNHFSSSLLAPVGAAFDFNAGTKPRAPLWMQRNGLEWLHRLTSEPRRLGWRYLSTNSLFFIQALRELSFR
jgi:N-acetylglucosaminyldiphosphoundecaprenol N-acetyl-beta-D-mannosaminyltransferase